jgi:TPR repeat protein
MAEGNLSKDKRTFVSTMKEARIGHREAQYEIGLMYANGIGVAQDISQAVSWIRQSAEKGLPAAQYLLATRYATGVGVVKDDHQAIQWYLKAVEQGHAKACFRLGKFYASRHHESAMAQISKAAELGLADAQFALANEFANGNTDGESVQKAAYWYLQAAQQGLAVAQCALADLYANGLAGPVDIDAALVWYRKAAQQHFPAALVAMSYIDESGKGRNAQARLKSVGRERRRDPQRWASAAELGDTHAKFNLGLMYELGLEVEADVSRAQEWYLAAARQGHAKAQLRLAMLLESLHDDGASLWYQKAAEQGEHEAQFAVGRICLSGQGADQDAMRGISWYLKAAEQGDPRALMTLAHLFGGALGHIAEVCFLKAAQLGVGEAQFFLGKHYEGSKGIAADVSKSLYWYKLAAVEGLAQAQCALGAIFLEGRGVLKDAQMALQWFQKAAAQGDAKARWNLSLMLVSGGDGVQKDLPQAFKHCQIAAEAGFVPAQSTLGVLFARMKKYKKAVEWWIKAADQGDPEAQYNLASALARGQGVVQNPEFAFQWFMKAAMQDLVPSQSRVGLLYATGEGVAQDLIEAHKWFIVAGWRGDSAAKENGVRAESQMSAAQVAEAKRRAQDWVQAVK